MPKSILLHCPQCLQPFAPKRAWQKQKFCSVECHNEAQRARYPIAPRFWARVDRNGPLVLDTPCWLWTGKKNLFGYGRFGSRTFTPHVRQAHCVAWELAVGPIPDGLFVLHKCDVRACVRPDHLFTGTHQDNMTDRNTKGRQAKGDRSAMRLHPEIVRRGEDAPLTKLTAPQVLEIRARFAGGERLVDLGRAFGVNPVTVSAVVRRETWKHLP